MAHELIDYEALCEEICTPETDTAATNVEQKPDITLIEVSSEGEFTRRDLTPELLSAHIEVDLKVRQRSKIVCLRLWLQNPCNLPADSSSDMNSHGSVRLVSVHCPYLCC
jgi:hypothetical protein